MMQTDKMHFLKDFNPQTSAREKRKSSRKSYTSRKPSNLYDAYGHLSSNGIDLCDCLDTTCPGCHFPCPKCRSNKCGHECRVNRKWMYDRIEIEGNDFNVKNKNK